MKLNGAKCPICTEGRLARHVGEFTMEYKGGSITFMDHVSYLCPSCGEDFSAGGENAKNDKSFIDFCRDIDGLLHPSHIRAQRQACGACRPRNAVGDGAIYTFRHS